MLRIAFAGALALILSLCLFVYQAEARPRHKSYLAHPDCNVLFPCAGVTASPRGEMIARQVGFGSAQKHYRPRAAARSGRAIRFASSNEGAKINTVILNHPSGCPRRAFCGCGAAVRVFGSPIRSLWLAANWFRFPRAAPGAGMVAVRRHHVFVLEAHLSGDTWIAYDANSGRHATRRHARSIAGYTIVNPRGSA